MRVCSARSRGAKQGQRAILILIELAPKAPVGVFEYVGITHYLADLFPGRVDMANRSSLKPFVRANVERDTV